MNRSASFERARAPGRIDHVEDSKSPILIQSIQQPILVHAAGNASRGKYRRLSMGCTPDDEV